MHDKLNVLVSTERIIMTIDEAIKEVESFEEGTHKFYLTCEHDLWVCVISGVHQGEECEDAVKSILSALDNAKKGVLAPWCANTD